MTGTRRHADDDHTVTGRGAGRRVVDAYEDSLSATQRRDAGAHYTPAGLARMVVGLALDTYATTARALPATVIDPSCGAGAFLLAAADELFDRGAEPATILTRMLLGVDIDADAVDAARHALCEWGDAHGVTVEPADLAVNVGDTLAAAYPAGEVDVVVGNPPFQSQLAAATTRSDTVHTRVLQQHRIVGRYTDNAVIHLLDACSMLRPDGVAAMVQPVSMLSARDADAVRERLVELADLATLWGSEKQLFAAAVHICVPVLRRRRPTVGAAHAPAEADAATTVVILEENESTTRVPAPSGRSSWAPLLAAAAGVPMVNDAETAGVLGSIAEATAGFRDEFYALTTAAIDTAAIDTAAIDTAAIGATAAIEAERRHLAPLVSVGMIDPLWLRRGHDTFRVAGRAMVAPSVDLDALDAASPRVSQWAAARRRPKVLVATQTKVIEVVVDMTGEMVPLTPTLSVEPHPGVDPWLVAVMLLAPPTAAHVAGMQWGSGRTSQTLRLPARLLMQLPCPAHREPWRRAASLARDVASDTATPPSRAALERIGATMLDAYGLAAHRTLMQWWSERLPRR